MTNEKMNFNILTNFCSSPKPTIEASTLPTVIIGAGPVALAACTSAAKKEPFLLIEVGPTVG
ncbi:hypothetical protein JQK62_19560, partial [Leptospira santarosai]|nr:hypothetical protein [Leptospira santarosai]